MVSLEPPSGVATGFEGREGDVRDDEHELIVPLLSPLLMCSAGQVDQAIHLGFEHIDTAQSCTSVLISNGGDRARADPPLSRLLGLVWTDGNEVQAGEAIRGSGLSREEIWVTTKWSGIDDKSPRQSCEESLQKVRPLNLFPSHLFPPTSQPDFLPSHRPNDLPSSASNTSISS